MLVSFFLLISLCPIFSRIAEIIEVLVLPDGSQIPTCFGGRQEPDPPVPVLVPSSPPGRRHPEVSAAWLGTTAAEFHTLLENSWSCYTVKIKHHRGGIFSTFIHQDIASVFINTNHLII